MSAARLILARIENAHLRTAFSRQTRGTVAEETGLFIFTSRSFWTRIRGARVEVGLAVGAGKTTQAETAIVVGCCGDARAEIATRLPAAHPPHDILAALQVNVEQTQARFAIRKLVTVQFHLAQTAGEACKR